MDIWSKDKRSDVMSRIRSKNTKPEIDLRSYLHAAGFRFRIHRKDLPGKPDIVLPKYKTVIFVHGCFWHYHADCNEGRIPSSNSKFWQTKLSKTIERDLSHQAALTAAGWQVIIIWECELEGKQRLEQTLRSLIDKIKSYGQDA
ncbi:MAG: DNA mismatch endonuclease Vsr [Bacteroidetes bacterium]|nr:DNA mismatch endonuclease Vsr [Bacteroidota bacterium]